MSRRPPARDRSAAAESCSVSAGLGAETLTADDLFDRECPENVRASQRWARHWHEHNWLVGTVLDLKLSFFNYGLTLTGANEKEAGKIDDRTREGRRFAATVKRYIGNVFRDYLVLDSVVSFWREQRQVPPYLLKPEMCRYSDAMGKEVLSYEFCLRPEILRRLNNDDRGRYATGLVQLDEAKDEYYRVLTRGNRGGGFGMPRLQRALRVCSQNESMEFGESRLAYGGRLAVRAHSLGFEVRGGGATPKMQAEYLWKKKRADAIEAWFLNRQGFAEMTRQFDHKIEYIWTDPKFYDGKKWETISNRLLPWSGPIGYLFMGRQINPALLGLLKAEAAPDRDAVREHVEDVIFDGFRLDCRVDWGDQCFTDLRIAWDQVKFLTQQGPLSLESALESADFDALTERRRKAAEASLPDGQVLPRFDKNHGNRPGDGAGRPAGTQNGDNVP